MSAASSSCGSQRQLGLVWRFFPLIVSTFLLSMFLVTTFFIMIFVFTSSNCFSFAVHMREVSCAGYTPRVWNLCSLQSLLNSLLQRLRHDKRPSSLVYNNNDIIRSQQRMSLSIGCRYQHEPGYYDSSSTLCSN